MKEAKKIIFIFLRYILIILASFNSLLVFYLIFTPLTIYPANFILNLIYTTSLSNNLIQSELFSIELIPACIAGSAYFLLLILNFSTPMKLKKRIISLLFCFIFFLAINIARISIFAILLASSFEFFDITHRIFWYAVSGVLVFLVWIITVKLFNIREIPFYLDMKFFYKQIKNK